MSLWYVTLVCVNINHHNYFAFSDCVACLSWSDSGAVVKRNWIRYYLRFQGRWPVIHKAHPNLRRITLMVVLQVLKKFAGATSIHGLAFIVDTRLSVFKRVTWSLIFTAAIMWASIQLQFAVTSKLRVDFLRINLWHKSLLFFGFLHIGILRNDQASASI